MAQDDFLQFQERIKQAESGGRRFDKSGKLLTSPKGAQGEMQVMPGTQTDPGFGVVPAKDASPDEIARVGRDYLAAMEKRYGDRSLAAIAYNMGPGATDKWIAKGSDFSKLPAETQAYVQVVMGGVPSATAQVSAAAPSPKATPAADMGVGYQAALALSFLNDQEDDDEKAVAKLDEEEDTQAAKMLAEYKPYNALADLDLSSTAPRQFADGGAVMGANNPLNTDPLASTGAMMYSHGGPVHRADGSSESGEVTGINKLVDFVAQRLDPSMFPTSARTLLETVQGTKTPITESNFSPEERDIMRQLAVLKGGQKGNIDYGDYVKLAEQMKKTGKVPVSVTPGLLSMADPMGNIQTTLGRFSYETDPKGNLRIIDRYDFNPIYDQGAMQEAQTGDYGALSPYGLVRNYAGEKIPPGKGREVLINLGPVKRAGGSPETGERPLTAEEIEAASKPAFLTPKSGIGRKISTKPGQIEGAVAQGVSETPYNLVGAPVDLVTMAMRPFGYSVEKPVMGSDWIKEKMSAAGVRPQPPSDPTSRAFYEIGQLGGGAINPAAPVRGAVAAGQKTGEAAKMLARDFQTYNQQLAVPGASYAIRPQQGGFFLHSQRSGLDEVDSFLRHFAGVQKESRDPLDQWVYKRYSSYMRGPMATEADPFVKGADAGRHFHFMDENRAVFQPQYADSVPYVRRTQGLPESGFAKTAAGQDVERAIDASISPIEVGDVGELNLSPKMKELAQRDRSAPVYEVLAEEMDNVLKPEELRMSLRAMMTDPNIPDAYKITPEQLQKMTLLDASEKAGQFERYMTEKEGVAMMRNARGVPVYKDYDDGYRWMAPADTAEDEVSKQYVLSTGRNAHWCTKEEKSCASYGSGNSHLFILANTKNGKPLVQVNYDTVVPEVEDWLGTMPWDQRRELISKHMIYQMENLPEFKQWQRANSQEHIQEIKGRYNETDLEGDALEKTRDLIRSKDWDKVNDIEHAQLYDTRDLYPDDVVENYIRPNFGTRFLTFEEMQQLPDPTSFAKGGMVERRMNDNRKYL